jgi:sugar lactone lactonase YvrE
MVHSIAVSNDGHVYVVDRTRRRVQVFTVEGKYVSQVAINPNVTQHSAVAVALSPDPEQRLLYIGDFGNSQIHTVDRRSLKVLGVFGARGAKLGEFQGLHDIAVDSKGNIYTAEVNPGARFQKLVPTSVN